MQHEAVETPEKGGEGFAGAGGGEDESVFASGDRRPALALWRGWVVEDGAEPGGGDRVEEIEDLSLVFRRALASFFGPGGCHADEQG